MPMPDLLSVLVRRWKLILLLTLGATALALTLCLLAPKQYLGVTTALPANAAVGDKARIFNQNIEGLYGELGSPDDLDRVEGTAKLDTIYLAATDEFHLTDHYEIDSTQKGAREKAARTLKKKTTVNRTGYGELQIKVWDKNSRMAADLANELLQKLNNIHQYLQTGNNRTVLQRLKDNYLLKQQTLNSTGILYMHDTLRTKVGAADNTPASKTMLLNQLGQYSQLINEYELALKTNPNVLLVVEPARPSPWADKPATGQIVLFTFLSSLLFSFLLALFLQSRNSQTQ